MSRAVAVNGARIRLGPTGKPSYTTFILSGGAGPNMCLGIPARVVAVTGTRARVDLRGREAEVDASVVPVEVGDYVLVYTGLVVQKLEPEEAVERLRLLSRLEAETDVTPGTPG